MTDRILIAGASGFVGRWLIKELKADFPEEALFGTFYSNNANIRELLAKNCFQLDLGNAQNVRAVINAVQPTQVIHLASLRVGTLEQLLNLNVLGFGHLLDALADMAPHARIVLIGSAAEIGKASSEDVPLNETILCQPVDNYGLTKQAQCSLAKTRANLGQDIVCLRVFNLLAPDIPEGLLPGRCAKLLSQITESSSKRVLEFGTLSTRRDYLDVRDLTKAIILALQRGKAGELFHIGSGKNYSGHELVQRLIDISGKEKVIYNTNGDDQLSLVPFQTADISLARQILGWGPLIDFNHSLVDLWSYYLAYS